METSKNRIRELREEKNITQIRLSIELGVSQETISAYETGKHYPSMQSILKLRNLFGVSIDYMLGLSEEKYPATSLDNLREDELTLLLKWNKLDLIGRAKAQSYIDGYLDAMRQSAD